MSLLVRSDKAYTKVESGLRHRMRFRFWPYHNEPDSVSYQLTGPYQISVGIVHRGEAKFVGMAAIEDLVQLTKPIVSPSQRPNDPPRWEVLVPITSELAQQINGMRHSNVAAPVRFTFDWKVLGFRVQNAQRSEHMAHPVQEETTPGSYSSPSITIEVSDWFQLLREFDLSSRRLIELTFPAVNRDAWLRAVQHLEQAERDFDSRNDKQVLDFCESVYEEILGKNIVMESDDTKAKSAIADVLRNLGLSDPRKCELAAGLIYAGVKFSRRGKHQASAAGHATFDPGSAEAELALLTTKSVLGYISRIRT